MNLREKAEEIIGILKMWDLDQGDSLIIAEHMVRQIKREKEWSNPLKGTGVMVPGHPGYKDPNLQ